MGFCHIIPTPTPLSGAKAQRGGRCRLAVPALRWVTLTLVPRDSPIFPSFMQNNTRATLSTSSVESQRALVDGNKELRHGLPICSASLQIICTLTAYHSQQSSWSICVCHPPPHPTHHTPSPPPNPQTHHVLCDQELLFQKAQR